MAKSQLYRYNAETDNFERVFPTVKNRMWSFVRILLLCLAVALLTFLYFYYFSYTPGERRLIDENTVLKQQYEILNRRVNNSLDVLEQIKYRDDNFYRVMLQMDPLSDNHRYAGVNNEKRYRELSNMNDNGLVKYVTQRVDLFDRSLYAQSLSFDEIKNTAVKNKDKMDHIPAIVPFYSKGIPISGGYGMRRDPLNGLAIFHSGIDYAVGEGTPVIATADGTVTYAERKNVYGNFVEIDHGYNYSTRYMHLSKMSVKPGESVKRGQEIGWVGNTGKSLKPHLHYEVRFRGESQNPVNYFFMQYTPEEFSDILIKAESASEIMD